MCRDCICSIFAVNPQKHVWTYSKSGRKPRSSRVEEKGLSEELLFGTREDGTYFDEIEEKRSEIENEATMRRLVGAILIEQNDEWAVQRPRYLTLETIAGLSDDPLVSLPPLAA